MKETYILSSYNSSYTSNKLYWSLRFNCNYYHMTFLGLIIMSLLCITKGNDKIVWNYSNLEDIC